MDGDISKVREYIKEGDDPSFDSNYPIQWTSQSGHFDIVKLLLQDKRVDPSDDGNIAIQWASDNGHIDVVKLLLTDHRFKMTDNLYQHKKAMNMINQIRQEKLKEVLIYINKQI